jgi:hypothetical protein
MLSKFCIWVHDTFLAFVSLKNRKIPIGGYFYANCPMPWTQELNKHGVCLQISFVISEQQWARKLYIAQNVLS